MGQVVDLEAGTVLVGGHGPDHSTPEHLLLRYANRHGMVAGATGTGKTVTLQTLAESLSLAGVPVVLADVKGDLAGLAMPGGANPDLIEPIAARAAKIGVDLAYQAFPVTFWDVFGERGHPVRSTPAEMGPLLLSRLLDLTPAQEGVMNIAFHVADEQGLALLDLQDLRAMLVWVGENASELRLRYGNVSSASIGAIQRALLVLETQGGDHLFGQPALDLADLIRLDASGKGVVNILAAERLMQSPRLYATFLLWLLSELFEQLPELGDTDKPRIAFFFDEAHLLFDDAPDALIDKIEQVARLIRSRGVSVWFISQNPTDVPDPVLGQIGNRVQHALRAFTARDQKALRLAAENYRPNPDFDTADAIQHVGTGEAVTSFLQHKGVPGIVQRTLIRPPFSRLGVIADDERQRLIDASPMGLKYGRRLDRVSAHEVLSARAQAAAKAAADAELFRMDAPRSAASARANREPAVTIDAPVPRAATRRRSGSDSIATTFGKSLARQLGTKAGQALVRGLLGSLSRSR
ncbi:helicase HerA-like domain-containing protein [uncultured Paracoccus sp.]|uniref:helicase HerA-like domain-containing protein n=1 Tax=uncultured Paracoccus sp. TaxID=189685 RepID=UPI002633E9C5|nr:helicase HerA-like domain-containing protein [uncultured Paracoccus sp.]